MRRLRENIVHFISVIIIIILVAVLVKACSRDPANTPEYHRGVEASRLKGYDEGQTQGYDVGKREGDAIGYRRGLDEGHAAGVVQGRSEICERIGTRVSPEARTALCDTAIGLPPGPTPSAVTTTPVTP